MLNPPSDATGKQQSAALRRREQLDRWYNSSTHLEPTHRRNEVARVNFDQGTIFLAACSQCDKTEVAELIRNGVDPNTTNVDGLTALHQACIDDNISMVEFLVRHGAKVNVSDNEGWTPLHATASCGYMDIASFLINNGADLGACNSDGDLAIDIAESDDIESLLDEAMTQQNVNAENARTKEENLMLDEANDWLQHCDRPELENPKTGATALHVAAAKGYVRVMLPLIQAGANINHQDNDGWTPLHGAAHWGQECSCKVLCEAMCDMDLRDNSGQTATDVADDSLELVMKELYQKQQNLRALNRRDSFDDIISTNRSHMVRRTSVNRMSNEEKASMAHTSSVGEQGTALITGINEEMETDDQSLPPKTDPAKQPQMKKEDPSPVISPPAVISTPTIPEGTTVPAHSSNSAPSSSGTSVSSSKIAAPPSPVSNTNAGSINTTTPSVATSSSNISVAGAKITTPSSSTTSVASTKITTSPVIVNGNNNKEKREEEKDSFDELMLYRRASGSDMNTTTSTTTVSDPTSWRAGLRKTGSTSAVTESSVSDRKYPLSVQKSASSGVLTSNTNSDDTKASASSAVTFGPQGANVPMRSERRPFAAIKDQGMAERSSYPVGVGRSNYIPYYKRQQMEREAKNKEKEKSSVSVPVAVTTSPPSTTSPSSVTSSPSSTTATSITDISPVIRRSDSEPEKPSERRASRFEPPKREDEAETNRKIKAKRARETRRSTQGVTQDDVKAAEATLKKADTGRNGSVSEPPSVNDNSQSDKEKSRTSISTSNSDTNVSVSLDEKIEEPGRRRAWQRPHATLDHLNSYSYDPSSPLSPSSRPPSSPLYSPRAQEEGSRSSFRKARDTIISANSSSSSIPDTLASTSAYSRYQRNSNENSEERSERPRYSWRTSERNGVESKEVQNDNKSREDEENDRNKSRQLRSKRNRRERRSTGVIYYDENEKKEDEKEKDTSETSNGESKNIAAPSTSNASTGENSVTTTSTGWGSRPFTSKRYGSASDVPSQMAGGERSDRSYTRYSRRQPTSGITDSASDVDYKKLYEETLVENEKLKKKIETLENESAERSKRSSTNESIADKRDRRALERKISELQEEIKALDVLQQDNARLKEENGALIRVISKLSK